MNSKRKIEIENPKMQKGQVIFVSGNDDGGHDEQFIKIATKDGNFNDFDYGVPAGEDVIELHVQKYSGPGGTINKIININQSEIYTSYNNGKKFKVVLIDQRGGVAKTNDEMKVVAVSRDMTQILFTSCAIASISTGAVTSGADSITHTMCVYVNGNCISTKTATITFT